MSEEAFEHLLDTSMDALMDKQQALHDQYALADMARWSLDQETATVQFFDEQDRLAVEGQILNIGSFSPNHSSWKWAWSNPSIPEPLRERALVLKELEASTGMDFFGEEGTLSLEDESMAWQLAAIAVQHLGALGCYRAASSGDAPTVYLALTELKHVSH
ncbi:DUF6882 domain-containing protein [Pseudomonas alabamensis]|uniref:DUF6882 domain-containing protein n=1 Tax=Pseudomonas alabamensis TaxID=3064349 RepID=UPI0021D88F3C|nr:DUF6882 domain-containing protein [Pseudomonas entomophila]